MGRRCSLIKAQIEQFDYDFLLDICRQWVETYNDEKNFPRSEYKEMWDDLAFAEDLLKRHNA